MRWFILALFFPLYMAWVDGSAYPFAFFITITGMVIYVPIAFISDRIEKKKIAEIEAMTFRDRMLLYQEWPTRNSFEPDKIEPGTFVPRPLAILAQVGLGWFFAGIITVILMWLGFVEEGMTLCLS